MYYYLVRVLLLGAGGPVLGPNRDRVPAPAAVLLELFHSDNTSWLCLAGIYSTKWIRPLKGPPAHFPAITQQPGPAALYF